MLSLYFSELRNFDTEPFKFPGTTWVPSHFHFLGTCGPRCPCIHSIFPKGRREVPRLPPCSYPFVRTVTAATKALRQAACDGSEQREIAGSCYGFTFPSAARGVRPLRGQPSAAASVTPSTLSRSTRERAFATRRRVSARVQLSASQSAATLTAPYRSSATSRSLLPARCPSSATRSSPSSVASSLVDVPSPLNRTSHARPLGMSGLRRSFSIL